MSTSKLQSLREKTAARAQALYDRSDDPLVVVSPYRMNPIGAHIDHQGGSVLARTIDEYSVVAFYMRDDAKVRIHCDLPGVDSPDLAFDMTNAGQRVSTDVLWAKYALGAAAVCNAEASNALGIDAVVTGTLPSSGLSSSASVILAYLHAFAKASKQPWSPQQYVEFARQVENNHVGLASGLQDQMSVVFGQEHSLSLLDMSSVTAKQIVDPPKVDEWAWVLAYSGFSRELVGSGFNSRVAECCEAAALLDSTASNLGQVALEHRNANAVAKLPEHLQRRVQHVYGEIGRVEKAAVKWVEGDAIGFGKLMNESCHSSINYYECGTQPMIDLHDMALKVDGVYGSRFGGGGYGGCLIMLAEASKAQSICEQIKHEYLKKYPEKADVCKVFQTNAESNVRIL